MIEDIINDKEFQNVLLSKNTVSNKKVKLEQIYKEKNIKVLDVSTQLFEYFDKKEMSNNIINKLIENPNLVKNFKK